MGLTRNFLATLTLLAAALIAPLSPAVADGGPFLVLDTGVHEAAINAMAPLADGGGIVTVSDDKTARIWRADGSEALGELLPPIGSGDDGALYAVATSAKVIAVAGRIRASQGGFGIAFYSTQDYRSLALISGLPSAVLAMKMSPAGDRLAVGLEGGGLRVFDLKTQTGPGGHEFSRQDHVVGFRFLRASGGGVGRQHDPALRQWPASVARHDDTSRSAGVWDRVLAGWNAVGRGRSNTAGGVSVRYANDAARS
jgi:WD40 repeat protein